MPKVDISVGNLVDMITRGELRLPELQRRYVWPATRVRDLVDSIYRGYPSGTILVWETDHDVPERAMAVQQSNSAFGAIKLLLDGQQRLTALSAILRGQPLKLKNRVRPIDIAFNLEHPEGPPSETLEVEDDQPSLVDEIEADDEPVEPPDVRAVQERVQHRTFVVAWRALLSDPHWLKVSDIFGDKTDWQLLSPLGLKPDDPRYDKYSKRLQRVRRIRDYQYVMQVLERNLSYEEVAEIFVRVNSLGMKLRGTDLALAQITARWPSSLELFEAFAEECERVWFSFDIGLLVRTIVVFATNQSRFRTVGKIPLRQLEAWWESAKLGLIFAVNFLRANAHIEDESLLSSPLLVIPIAVLAVLRQQRLSADDEAALLQWLLLANALGHYSSSTETVLDSDLAILFRGGGPAQLIDALKHQSGHVKFQANDFAGRGIQNPLYQTAYLALKHGGAKDWSSGLGVSLTHSGRNHYVESHHIFPRSVLAKQGFAKDEINEIANRAFISGGKNRALGNKTPDVYFPKVLETRGVEALTSQAIPVSDRLWKVENYREFLATRREALAAVVNAFLEGSTRQAAPGDIDVGELIAAGEGPSVEFKETGRYNSHTKQADPIIESMVVKAVAGLINARGGVVLIGVDDAGVLLGLERDLRTLGNRQNHDGYEQFIRRLIKDNLGPTASSHLEVTFPSVDGVEVCRLTVGAARSPIYARDGAAQAFYVRLGNTTQALNHEQSHAYIREHFA